MTPTKDDGERARALTDLDATLLVEASAGTGKTSLLAGRVAMLLAEKRPPSSIAAITFTERAAAELRSRVMKFADSLIEDEVPTDLEPAFRKRRLDEAQRRNLREAKDQLGELTACTIHAFCLSILQTYAIEARIDPGASVMDAEQTALAFDSVLDAWLTERLGEDADLNDPIVVMASDDPARAIRTLRDLAEFRRAHPKAKPAGAGLYQGPVRQFVEAVAEYRRWMNRITAPEKALADVEAFEELANLLVPAAEDAPSFGELLVLLHPDSPLLPARKPDFDDSRVLFAYRTRGGAWNKATDATRGPLLAQEDQAHYENCASLFGRALGEMADALLSQYFGETDSLMNRFEEYKLSAAVLDFDDILARTHHLLLTNTKVRQDVAARFRHVLVDEFQDTDPLQCQILMLVCGDDSGTLRSGSLFLVGDPKQSIYRFRGADLDTYLRMRDTIAAQFPGNVLHVTANFRSEKRILAHVDRAFADRLRAQLGSYGKLESTIEDAHSLAAVRHSYPTKQTDNSETARQSEAKEIADLCAGLVGNVEIRRSDGSVSFAEPGDIALLSPSRTGLWLYERALEDKGLPVASQAGKNLYRRQETQDIVALVRALADNRDTLALGALLRGPLIGFTERELLDVTLSLRAADENAALRLQKDALPIANDAVRAIMDMLNELWRKRRGTTPHALLSEALDRLHAIPALALRAPDQRSRSLANLASLLKRARGYHVRGLKQFAIDLSAEWERSISFDEAPADHARDSIDIVTIHKAKGLEWPIVIPINLVSMWRRPDHFFHRVDDNSIHWTLGDVVSSSLAATVQADKDAMRRENERQLYVACTRALDLLILPDPSQPRTDSWFSFFDLGQQAINPIRLPAPKPRPVPAPSANTQTASEFAAEAALVAKASPEIMWFRPSVDDADRELLDHITAAAVQNDADGSPVEPIVGAGGRRGVILHRLMEELIAGLCPAEQSALFERADALLTEAPEDGEARPLAEQLASTALQTFTHPKLAPFRIGLLAEVPLYGARSEAAPISARADAIAVDERAAALACFDWKSDVAPTDATRGQHKGQLAQYLQLIGAPLGAVVYLTTFEFCWIRQDGSDGAGP